MPCPKKHKMFLSYLCVSTKECLHCDTNITDQNIRLDNYDKDRYRECNWCCQVSTIKIAFKENEFICNGCYKLLKCEKISELISPKIYLYRTGNQLYRLCTNLDRYYAELIFDDEMVEDKEGSISKENIYKFLNSKI